MKDGREGTLEGHSGRPGAIVNQHRRLRAPGLVPARRPLVCGPGGRVAQECGEVGEGGGEGRCAGRQLRDQGDAGQRCLVTLAPLQQPLWEVRAGAQLGDRDVDRADPVQVPVPVPVALVDPLRDGLTHPGPKTAPASADSSELITVPST